MKNRITLEFWSDCYCRMVRIGVLYEVPDTARDKLKRDGIVIKRETILSTDGQRVWQLAKV